MTNLEKVKGIKNFTIKYVTIKHKGDVLTWAGKPQIFEIRNYDNNNINESFSITGVDSGKSMNINKFTEKFIHVFDITMLSEVAAAKIEIENITPVTNF
tara:strand:- start:162 stop:458 length:297 start_codon:yes stop_codon:yes gene_type:complete